MRGVFPGPAIGQRKAKIRARVPVRTLQIEDRAPVRV